MTMDSSGDSSRRPKRFLTAEQKYDLFVRMLAGQLSQSEAAAEVGVDRSTISNLRKTAREGALAALSARPGKPKASRAERTEVAALRAEVERLGGTVIEQAIELAGLRAKGELGMNGPIPARVSAAIKEALLGLVDDAVEAGWSLGRICGVLQLDRQRVWRWRTRQRRGTLGDRQPGGNPNLWTR